MKIGPLVCAAFVAAMLPSSALADDPLDPEMRTAAARARDREIIRQLNRQELGNVRERDAGYEAGWRAWREGDGGEFAARSRNYQRDADTYARDRAAYDKQMSAWRRAVAACRAGDYSACDG